MANDNQRSSEIDEISRLLGTGEIPEAVDRPALMDDLRNRLRQAIEITHRGPKSHITISSNVDYGDKVELLTVDYSHPYLGKINVNPYGDSLKFVIAGVDRENTKIQSLQYNQDINEICKRPIKSSRLIRKYSNSEGIIFETREPLSAYTAQEFEELITELNKHIDELLYEISPEAYASMPYFNCEIRRSQTKKVSVRRNCADGLEEVFQDDKKPLWIEQINPEIMPGYEDIVGNDLAKKHLFQTVMQNVASPEIQKRWGIERQHILLYGPPGTGKTMLAKAIAREIQRHGHKINFFSVNSSQLKSMWHGETEKNVDRLFDFIAQHRPAILFIDEIDSLCRSRKDSFEVSQNMLNAFLRRIDGMQALSGVTIIAATNRREVIDEAILRPGRFTKHIAVDLPEESTLFAMLNKENCALPVPCEVSRERLIAIAAENRGKWSGADVCCFFQQLRQECFSAEVRDGRPLERIDAQMFEAVYKEYQLMRTSEEKTKSGRRKVGFVSEEE